MPSRGRTELGKRPATPASKPLRGRPRLWQISGRRRSSSVVERTLGKGEVESSILSCGTTFSREAHRGKCWPLPEGWPSG